MWRTFLVAVGSAIGGVARYWMSGMVQQLNGTDLPLGTLAVNLLGSVIVGAVMVLSLEREMIDADFRAFLAIGLCGGFTTMSAFSYETLAFIRHGQTTLALGNMTMTLLGCVAAAGVGAVFARLL